MKLIWLDLETTGLTPETDAILEVAAFEATLERPFDAVKIYDCVLRVPPTPFWERLHPIVQKMHTDNGLWAACAESVVTCMSAEVDLCRRISDDEDKAVLAGSSVHFDHSFIRHHMPALNARFSHRHYDVSAVSLFARSLGMPKLPKTEAHRAAQDCLDSIAQAKAISEWFRGRAA
jgi:oligoribonuclease